MTKRRIRCPHCDELISSNAKKCKHCKEWLNKKEINNKDLTTDKFFLVWLGSMVIFYLIIWIVNFDFSDKSIFWVLLLGIDVISGMVSFFALTLSILKGLFIKKKRIESFKYLITSTAFFIVFFFLLFNIGNTPNNKQSNTSTTNNKKEIIAPSNSPTLQPTKINKPVTNTNSNNINCTGPDGVVFKTTQEECDKFNSAWRNEPSPDPNEYIRCNIHENCGGGYKEMTRASCERLICCQINDSWELRDKDQCNTEQEQEATAEWIEFCNSLYNPDSCSTYWESGTSQWYDCRSDAFDGRISCYNDK